MSAVMAPAPTFPGATNETWLTGSLPPRKKRAGYLTRFFILLLGGIDWDLGCGERVAWFETPKTQADHAVHKWTVYGAIIGHPPVVRHLWGDAQYELHPGGQELFLDLIFVGVAYEVGTVLKASFYSCTDGDGSGSGSGSGSASGSGSGSASGSGSGSTSGSGSGSASGGRRLAGSGSGSTPSCIGLARGVLHSVAPFLSMYMLWTVETSYRARYLVSGWVHTMCDLLGNLILILAALNIVDTYVYRGLPAISRAGVGVSMHLLWVMSGLGLWMLRTCEVAFYSPREAARRESLAEVIAMLQVLGMLATAMTLVLVDFGDDGSNAEASDWAVGIIWCSNFLWYYKRFTRACKYLLDPGTRILDRLMTSANGVFIFHRNNEFMFLMLGESVLQMAIASVDTSGSSTFVKHAFSAREEHGLRIGTVSAQSLRNSGTDVGTRANRSIVEVAAASGKG